MTPELVGGVLGYTLLPAIFAFVGSYAGIFKRNTLKLPLIDKFLLFPILWLFTTLLMGTIYIVLRMLEVEFGYPSVFWPTLIVVIVIGRKLVAWRANKLSKATAAAQKVVKVENDSDETQSAATGGNGNEEEKSPWTDRKSRIPWRERSKLFRYFWFLSGCWAIGVLLYVAYFDPYGNGAWSYMDDDEFFHMLSVMIVLPAFMGLAIYVWQRFVK